MQNIADFWRTTKGKLIIGGCGGLAGLLSICFVCIVFRVFIRSSGTAQEVELPPTEVLTEALTTETPTALLPTETSTKPLSTKTPTAPPTTETSTPEVLKPIVTAVESNVNIRSGPSADYEVISTLLVDESLEIIGRNADSSWWQVSTPNGLAWIAASVVTARNVDDGIPIVEAPPPPIQSTFAEPPPQPTIAPTQPNDVAICDCSGDAYNCSDFDTHQSAQACFDYCQSIGRGDIHRLDRDNDNVVCESLR